MMMMAVDRKQHQQSRHAGRISSLTRDSQATGKSSNSSNETVIARLDENKSSSTLFENKHLSFSGNQCNHLSTGENGNKLENNSSSEQLSEFSREQTQLQTKTIDQIEQGIRSNKTHNKSIRNLIQFAGHHLNPFHHYGRARQQNSSKQQRKHSLLDHMTSPSIGQQQLKNCELKDGELVVKSAVNEHQPRNGLVASWAQRYFNLGGGDKSVAPTGSKSMPATPIKCLEGVTTSPIRQANGYAQTEPIQLVSSSAVIKENSARHHFNHCKGFLDDQSDSNKAVNALGEQINRQLQQQQQQQHRPSVRFVESTTGTKDDQLEQNTSNRRRPGWAKLQRQQREQVKFADCGVQTSADHQRDHDDSDTAHDDGNVDDDDQRDEDEGIKLVARLFKLPDNSAPDELAGECPMDSNRFRDYGYKLIDYISNYLDTIGKRRVTPLNIEPGYLKTLIQPDAPEQGQSFATIMHDFESHIMCGITHWQHPHFHAYFPAGNAYPSILADMLSDALGCVGFSWAASPAYTELEIIMLDWMGKMIGLPDEFLCLSGARNGQESKGGGVIQGSASECVLVNLLAARHWAMEKLRKKYPGTPDGLLLSRLIGYCSKEAHSCVEKASMIGFIRMRALETDEKHSLRGETLIRAIEADKAQGLEPFIVCATLGTTSCVSFDNLEELGQVCRANGDIWLHVDAAYAGSALICPEFKYLMKGIEMATSFNMNPNKWMLINFDCSLMWVKDRFKLTRAFVVDPLYLQHSFSDQAIDYRHWGIPLSRRFRALKLWFVIRNYGVEGLRAYIRNHVKLAKLFEQCIREDQRFTVTNEVVLGLVCFRLIGSNALNQRLLSMINASGKLHMVPASLNGRYVIRFCVCDQYAKEADILFAYRCISDFATELFESIRAGKERIRAISQQNTIDVSSISLHTQQSASADRLNSGANAGLAAPEQHQAQPQQQAGPIQQQVPMNRQQSLIMGRNSRHGATLTECGASETTNGSPAPRLSKTRSPITKQASILHHGSRPDSDEADDLEQEIPIESLATIDGCDYDLDLDDDDLEEELADEQIAYLDESDLVAGERHGTTPGAAGQDQVARKTGAIDNQQATSPMQRAYETRHERLSRGGRASRAFTDGNEQEEAADEVFKLADKRHRMSVRYKREFFVRVVSDPRVYRASISGDINAHASTSSLGSSSGQQQQSQQQQQRNQTSVPDESNKQPKD